MKKIIILWLCLMIVCCGCSSEVNTNSLIQLTQLGNEVQSSHQKNPNATLFLLVVDEQGHPVVNLKAFSQENWEQYQNGINAPIWGISMPSGLIPLYFDSSLLENISELRLLLVNTDTDSNPYEQEVNIPSDTLDDMTEDTGALLQVVWEYPAPLDSIRTCERIYRFCVSEDFIDDTQNILLYPLLYQLSQPHRPVTNPNTINPSTNAENIDTPVLSKFEKSYELHTDVIDPHFFVNGEVYFKASYFPSSFDLTYDEDTNTETDWVLDPCVLDFNDYPTILPDESKWDMTPGSTYLEVDFLFE